jgi:hypothetical protein
MAITISALKAAFTKKKYVWADGLNIIGIRTKIQVPDIFNDLMCVVWKQPIMPAKLSAKDKQIWLNNNLFVGKNGEPLLVDGDLGTNSLYAIDEYNKVAGKERIRFYTITTDPGTYYLQHPMNTLGTAVLKPGQYPGSHAFGYHHQKQDHPALVQVGTLTVYRDNDKDNVPEVTKVEDKGSGFGINIHGANKNGITTSIGKWSAGCQVFCEWNKKEEFLTICKIFQTALKNKYTYTLLEEQDMA